PYDTPTSDLVLQSSTGVCFFVHKKVLSHASLLFSEVLSLPQGELPANLDDSSDFYKGRPCIRMQEDTRTLHSVLNVMY
ncbi:hypothetical protein K488DRAFT_29428, partial [Vararia minispora EC-137]